MRRILIPILLALLVVSCAKQTATQKQVSLESPFAGGTTGLSISFQDLRKDVFDSGRDPFDVVVKLENKGETLVHKEDVRVKLSGINPAEFSKTADLLSSRAPDDLIEVRKDPQGKTLLGQPVYVEFLGFNHQNPIAGATAQFSLRADACSLYKTQAVTKLCARQDILNPRAGGICEVTQDKPVYNSGSPVQISNVQESTRGKDKIGISFDVKNVGSGNLFERSTFCDRSARKNEDHVYVIIKTDLAGLQCSGLQTTSNGAEGFITLYNGLKTVSCAQPLSTSGDFEQLVTINLIYDYEISTQTTFTVKNSGDQ